MSRLEILKTLDGQVYFRGISFSSVQDIDKQIDEAQERMDNITSKLKQLAAATPIAITPSGYTPLEYINEKTDDLMTEYFDVCQSWNLLVYARSVINDYAVRKGISLDNAFEKCYVDKFVDLK